LRLIKIECIALWIFLASRCKVWLYFVFFLCLEKSLFFNILYIFWNFLLLFSCIGFVLLKLWFYLYLLLCFISFTFLVQCLLIILLIAVVFFVLLFSVFSLRFLWFLFIGFLCNFFLWFSKEEIRNFVNRRLASFADVLDKYIELN
jgi:hypothetical protein